MKASTHDRLMRTTYAIGAASLLSLPFVLPSQDRTTYLRDWIPPVPERATDRYLELRSSLYKFAFINFRIGTLPEVTKGDSLILLNIAYTEPKLAPAAQKCLRTLGPKLKESLPELIRALEHGSMLQKGNAADLIGLLGKEGHPAIPALIKALISATEDSNFLLRHSTSIFAESLDMLDCATEFLAKANLPKVWLTKSRSQADKQAAVGYARESCLTRTKMALVNLGPEAGIELSATLKKTRNPEARLVLENIIAQIAETNSN